MKDRIYAFESTDDIIGFRAAKGVGADECIKENVKSKKGKSKASPLGEGKRIDGKTEENQ